MADAVRYLGRLRPALAAGLLLLAGTGRAQAPRAGDTPVHFSVFSATPIRGLAYAEKAKAEPVPVVFYPTARSPRYEYRGAMPLRFLDQSSGAVIAEAVIPAEIREALLLFLANDGAPAAGKPASAAGRQATALKYRIAVVDAGATRHAAGQLAIINLSGLALQGKVNGGEVALQEGLNPPRAVGSSLAIALHTSVKGRTFQAYAANLALKPRDRALLVLLPPYYQGSVEVQSRLLVDTPPSNSGR